MLGGLHAGDELEQPRHILRPVVLRVYVYVLDVLLLPSFLLYCHYFMFTLLRNSSLRGQDDFSGHAGTGRTAGTQCVLSRSHSFPLERGITSLPEVTSPSRHLEVPAY